MRLRALLASPLGFLIGLSLGAVGGGGSILAVPVLVYVAGEHPRAATTTSLVVVGAASLVGLTGHWRAGRVRVGVGVAFGLAGIGGSILGAAVNRRLDPDVLLLAFAALTVFAAHRMLTACPTCTSVGEQRVLDGPVATTTSVRPDTAVAVKVVAAGTVVGFFTGLFGVGGGFIIIPALTLLLGFAMPEAIGTSLLIIAVNCAVALAARVGSSGIDWAVTVPFAVAAVAGVLAGGSFAGRVRPATLLRWFAALLVVVAAYTAVRSAIALLA